MKPSDNTLATALRLLCADKKPEEIAQVLKDTLGEYAEQVMWRLHDLMPSAVMMLVDEYWITQDECPQGVRAEVAG